MIWYTIAPSPASGLWASDLLMQSFHLPSGDNPCVGQSVGRRFFLSFLHLGPRNKPQDIRFTDSYLSLLRNLAGSACHIKRGNICKMLRTIMTELITGNDTICFKLIPKQWLSWARNDKGQGFSKRNICSTHYSKVLESVVFYSSITPLCSVLLNGEVFIMIPPYSGTHDFLTLSKRCIIIGTRLASITA